nr:hypothetical protein CFP56_54096 [Quercus suber]
MAHAETCAPPTVLPRDSSSTEQATDALSLVGLKSQDEKDLIDVSSPLKPTPLPINAGREEPEIKTESIGPLPRKKPKAKVQIKKMAREKGNAKGPASETQFPSVGSKRAGKLIFEDEEEDLRTKKRCTKLGISQPFLNECTNHQNTPRQYGEWLRAYGNTRAMGDRSKSTSSDGGGEGGHDERRDIHTHTVERNSSASVMDDGCGSNDGPRKNGEKNRNESEKLSVAGSEKKLCEKTLKGASPHTYEQACFENCSGTC